jgi:signal transduction protein with GAF and PtsI domain
MTFSIHGLAVARGIAIGRAVLVASSRADVAHYFVKPDQVNAEIQRLRVARDAVVDELQRLQKDMPKDAPHELDALLDVHLMLLQDEELTSGVVQWIKTRLYNAEWALTSQLDIIVRQFEEMEDPYLRERKADMEQVGERVLHCLKGTGPLVAQTKRPQRPQQELQLGDTDVPLVLVAHDLSPADMLQFKQSVFTGFVTDVGGKTSHTAIVARSSGHSGGGGCAHASQLVKQDDWVIIDGDAGVVIVDPSPIIWPITVSSSGRAIWSGSAWRACAIPRPSRSMVKKSSCWPTSKCLKTPWRHHGGRGRCGAVPQRIFVHGPPGPFAKRRGAIPSLPPCGGRHEWLASDHPHGGRGGRQTAGRHPS